jgi:hypothetical protein
MKITLAFLGATAATAFAGSIFPPTTIGYALTVTVSVIAMYPGLVLVSQGFTPRRYVWFSVGMVLGSTLFYSMVQPYIPESYVQGMTAGILLTGVIGAIANNSNRRTNDYQRTH